MKILVVEDDKGVRQGIENLLLDEKYIVVSEENGEDGLFSAEDGEYDALILDIMLPGMNGLEIVKELRIQGNHVPILLLTARDSVEDRVKGLDAGADDYLIKPFAGPELLARLRVLLRDRGTTPAEELSFGNITLNKSEYDGYVDSKKLSLTVKEYQLLEYFLRNPNQILLRDQIFNRVWGYSSDVGLNAVDVYVHYLRKKLALHGCEHLLKTVRGIGFMLQEEK
ncbi:DNA-binding response regulator, OmpR family, contains REC and winged-helix (wHTH) domain [Fictibacillus enclensis]|uniref:Two-component system response regulator n=1 Tax=Fictibacillus enclensis TaxID=1017270 RepID=A0A0V8J7Q0_9BACL|nr:response regulator transcription factor [Fictibacillus enclensis]KSU83158.1 two-component system response regulator [Fictibacillus enclensis]SCC11036.1 DNA-binding response regulator, OmpR family, contains REC and winged-helix (wHTH) domain [Fictibacillus enclensis]